MVRSKVRQRAYEHRGVVQRLRADDLHPERAALLDVLEVDLVQRLDVVARERDGHDDRAFAAEAREALDRLPRLHAHPRRGPHLRLPDEPVGVRVPEAAHDGGDGRCDFGHVWVSAVHDRHWKGVRGEEEYDVRAHFFRESGQRAFDVLRNSLRKNGDRGW